METSVTLLIFLGAISGVIHGAGVLPDTLTALVGETVTFNTTVPPTVTPFVVITWSFEDSQGAPANIITSTSVDVIAPAYKGRVQLHRATGSLELRNVTIKDSGEYKLTIIPSGDAQKKGSCRLLIDVPVSSVTVTPSRSTDLVEFSSISLSCSASGSSLSFLWMNGSSAITPGDGVQVTDGGSVLTIARVSRYDQGPFRCHVSNPVSSSSSDPVTFSVSYGPENVSVTLSPPREYHETGSNISLSCSAVSRPAALYHWFLNGDKLAVTGPELRLINVQESQSGSYSCQAFNNETQRSEAAQVPALTVLAPVMNVEVNASSTDLVEFNSSAHLSCSASGSSLSFLWMNGSSEVTAGDRVQLTDRNSSLLILNVTRYDQGPFRCVVSNPVSNGTTDPVSLLIILGPENINLTVSPPQEYHDEGSDVRLTCSAVSRPAALYRWFMNGNEMSDTGPELELINVHSSQSGNYRCQAFNNRTMRRQTSQPVVVTVLKSNVSDVVISPSGTDLVEFNSSARLSCSASGSSLSFLWMNGSSEVTAGDRVQLTDDGATLTLVNVSRYDQGPFRCHVSNSFSESTSGPVKLSISFGPENINLKLLPSQQYYEEGSDIKLLCSAESRPAASYYWFLNGGRLPATGPELRLVKIEQRHSGEYSCQAFNSKTLRYDTSDPAAVTILEPVSNITVTPSSTDLLEFHSSARLTCTSSGSALAFLWLNGSSEVTPSDRVRLSDANSTLTIFNVTRYDQGPFRCNVSNGVTSEMSQSVKLIVQYGPDNVNIVGPASTHAGLLTLLYCSAESVPAAKFSWTLQGKPTAVREPVLVIQSSQESDSGTYACTAENAVTGRSQTARHDLTVTGLSDCDSSAAAARAAIFTALCFIALGIVGGIIVFCLLRRRSIYPARQKQKQSVKAKHLDVYKITGSIKESDL